MAVDPLALYDSIVGGNVLPAVTTAARAIPRQPTAPRPPAIPNLTPEEEDSILAQLGHGTLSTLGYIGGTLDKLFGGRAIRGLLGGEARELLSIIPGSDTIGLTRPEDAVSGSDLVENLGLTNTPNQLDLADVLGFGAEVALDPATYLTLGTSAALSSGGKVAKAAGVLPKTRLGRLTGSLDDVIKNASPEVLADLERAAGGAPELAALNQAEPLSGLAAYGLPFGTKTPFATGETAQKIASQLDTLGEAVKFSYPGRIAGALFDYERRDVLSEPAQRARMEMTDLQRTANFRSGRDVTEVASMLDPLDKLYSRTGNLGGQEADSLLRQAVEGVPVNPAVALESGSDAALGLEAAAKKMRSDVDELHQSLRGKYGYNIGTVEDDFTQYMHRTATSGKRGWRRLKDRLFDMEFDGAQGRAEYLQNIPGGTEQINRWTRDLDLVGEARPLADDEVVGIIRNDLGLTPERIAAISEDIAALERGGPDAAEVLQRAGYDVADDAIEAGADQLLNKLQQQLIQPETIASWLKGLPPELAGKRLYGDTLRDYQQYLTQGRRTEAAVQKYLDLLADNSKKIVPEAGDSVSLLSTIKKSGKFGESELNPETIGYLMDRAGIDNVDDLKNLGVPKEIADDAERFIVGYSRPDALVPIINAYDMVTQAFKSGVTTPWPGFSARNLMTGIWMGYVGGAFDPTAKAGWKYAKPWLDQRKLLAGEVIEGASQAPIFKGLSDAEATKKLAEMQFAYGLTTDSILHEVGGPLVDAAPGTLSRVLDQIPGRTPRRPVADYLRDLDPRGKSWGDIAASPLRAGEQLTNSVENMNRGSMFWAFLKQGMTPEAAARKAKDLNVNYAEAAGTQFERSVAKRVMPFYSFTKGMLPVQLESLIENPGGPIRQAIRLTESNRDQSGFTPYYLQDSLAIPVGAENEDGTRRYLTQLDMPHEILNDVGAGQQALGMLNPLIKAPLELATGRSFFAGRDLRDLDPRSGRILSNIGILSDPKQVPPWLDTVIGATPAARVMTSIGQIVDPRKDALAKATNLLTGIRLSDVDMDKQRQIAAREAVTENLRGQPGIGVYEKLYVRDGEKLSPHDWMLIRLQETNRRRQAQQRRDEARAAAKPTLVEALANP